MAFEERTSEIKQVFVVSSVHHNISEQKKCCGVYDINTQNAAEANIFYNSLP